MHPGPNSSNDAKNSSDSTNQWKPGHQMTALGAFPNQNTASHATVGSHQPLISNFSTLPSSWAWPVSNASVPHSMLGGMQHAQILDPRQTLIMHQIRTLQQRALELRAEEYSINAALAAQAAGDTANMPTNSPFHPPPMPPSALAALYQQGKPPPVLHLACPRSCGAISV